MDLGPAFGYPLDEFALNNDSAPVPGLGWKIIGDSGDPTQGYQMVRIERNGAFYGVFSIVEKLDNQWRDHHGYDNWAMYKVQALAACAPTRRRPRWPLRATSRRRPRTTPTSPTSGS